MKKIFFIPILALLSCGQDPDPLPACRHDIWTVGEKVYMNIYSESDFVIIHREDGRWHRYESGFFLCIKFRADPGEVLVVEDDGVSCEIVVP